MIWEGNNGVGWI
uniref:Uncharacterized protein n=1 Tax=Arundo donax TaxID=35708 RepID=A0A0A9AN57_ARUDO